MGMWSISGKIVREEGFRKLFRATNATFAREFMFSGGLCCAAPYCHTLLKDEVGVDSQFLVGAMAGVMSQVLSQPFDTVKSWIETHSVSTRVAVEQINQQGLGFYWKGTLPRAFRGAWTLGCLTFVTNYLKGIFIESRIEPSSSQRPVNSTAAKR
mmetsp:Transcript_31698/g.53484  ORF Transcript_31698/g.53484 Transcript_31698/m.53484 type:complete len:155 (+) Transcript_31698:636-1100(+)